MNQEVLFAKTLEQVRTLAKEQGGYVTKEQVQEAFQELNLDETQLQLVYDYLQKHKVGIGEPVESDEYLTSEEKNYLQNYLDEIGGLPEYTSGEVEAFTISAMAGDINAQNRLLEVYLKDVVDIAKLYAGQGVSLEDLIGEGNVALTVGVGMLGGLEHQSEAKGTLARMVMDAMEDFIAENTDSFKVDRKVADKVNKVADAAKDLSEGLERDVTVEELARETGMSEKAIRDAIRISGFRIDGLMDEGTNS